MPEFSELLIIAGFLVVAGLVLLGLRWLVRHIPQESSRESYLRWRGCSRKRAYATKRDAEVVVDRHAREGDVVEAYQCRWCEQWHVGHPWPLQRGR